MKNIDFNAIPKFDQLPVRKDAPAESSWGVFGDNDALGCLNFLTPAGIVEAAKEAAIQAEVQGAADDHEHTVKAADMHEFRRMYREWELPIRFYFEPLDA